MHIKDSAILIRLEVLEMDYLDRPKGINPFGDNNAAELKKCCKKYKKGKRCKKCPDR